MFPHCFSSQHSSSTGLLSTKAARLFPRSTVVSLASDAETSASHLRLLKLLELDNNFVCVPNTTAPLYSLLRSLPDTFDVQFLPFAFESLSSLPESVFLAQLGSLLSLATTTLIPLPNPRRLSLARQLFNPPEKPSSFEQIPTSIPDPDQILLDLAESAAKMGGLINPELSIVQGGVLRISASSVRRPLPSHYLSSSLSSAPLARPGISLYTLVSLNLVLPQRRQLVAPLLALGLPAEDMSPWNLIYHDGYGSE